MTIEELREASALLQSFLVRYRKRLARREVQAPVETCGTALLSGTGKRYAEAVAMEIGGGEASGPATIPQLRAVVAPAVDEDWKRLDRRYATAEYDRRRNDAARESRRRSALRKVS